MVVKSSLVLTQISRISSLRKLKCGEKGRGGIKKQCSDCLEWRHHRLVRPRWSVGSTTGDRRRDRGNAGRGSRSPRAGVRARAGPGEGADVNEKAESSRPRPSLALARNRAGKGRKKS